MQPQHREITVDISVHECAKAAEAGVIHQHAEWTALADALDRSRLTLKRGEISLQGQDLRAL